MKRGFVFFISIFDRSRNVFSTTNDATFNCFLQQFSVYTFEKCFTFPGGQQLFCLKGANFWTEGLKIEKVLNISREKRNSTLLRTMPQGAGQNCKNEKCENCSHLELLIFQLHHSIGSYFNSHLRVIQEFFQKILFHSLALVPISNLCLVAY